METTLVSAGPGTGKTTSLSSKYVSLVKSGVDQNDILCLTFTNKAVDNMREAILKTAQREGVELELHKLNVHTFHSFAFHFVKNLGYRDIINHNFLRKLIYDYLTNNHVFNYDRSYIIDRMVPSIENAIRYVKSYNIGRIEDPQNILNSVREDMDRVIKEKKIDKLTLDQAEIFMTHFINIINLYEQEKENRKVIDYNDMLIKFINLSEKPHYKYVLIDELQDVSDLEAKIAGSVAENIYAVGDKKQSIFGFQGGGFSNFISNFPNHQLKYLTEDHRNGKAILKYAKEFFKKSTKGGLDEDLEKLTSVRDHDGYVEVIEGSYSDILSVLDRFPRGSVGIIARTNAQVINISKVLDSHGIKYSSSATSSNSEMAKNDVLDFLRMILFDDDDFLIKGLFTPFSGLSIAEAYNIKESVESGNSSLLNFTTLNSIKKKFSVSGIKELLQIFENVVLPVAVSLGSDYYGTAKRIYMNLQEYLYMYGINDRQDLLNYLEVCDQELTESSNTERISVLTVHKAKGLEFDHVIYLPKTTRDNFSVVDLCAYELIREKTKRDISTELEDEDTRVDFVAITRPVHTLIIITDHLERYANKYAIKSGKPTAPSTEHYSITSVDPNIEAYSAFINGRFDQAINALDRYAWIRNLIRDNMKKNNVISFSLLQSLQDPFQFLKEHILGLKYKVPAMKQGSEIHTLAELLFKKESTELEIPPNYRPQYDNILKVIDDMQKRYGAVQISAEEEVTLPGQYLLPEAKSFILYGKLDAVFQSGDYYYIVDYKTDKTTTRQKEHTKQLHFYKTIYSKSQSLDRSKIKTLIAYISLRTPVNTGKVDYRLEEVDNPNSINLEEEIRKYITFTEDPDKFIEYLLNFNRVNHNVDDSLVARILGYLKHR
ncbi:rep helicase single-stranded DNA-dependent ATPase [Thermoplasma volcanium GSS1]|uniref:DNA 3'-5' helicase n=1 Tax=Thermoplasma volcanium (strain ATCC 51530 / DSM 4299 / JCM 9571 / NBRC 15438 / GSS1) TaxID=273116 RepID=Q97AQ9_THEVO|nr:ATP-dependent helicase [Thermoplasma volcanium]BAB59892.1 rep helicase single-stranded DNA-dependent ATPase [Thermoplasma volcanium GSS1]